MEAGGLRKRALGMAPWDMLCTQVAEAAFTKVERPAGGTFDFRPPL